MSTFEIALTGHRPNKLGGYNLKSPAYQILRQTLAEEIINNSLIYKHIICHSGMALGADTIWALAINDARTVLGNHQIEFIADIPCPEQPRLWHQNDQQLWKILVDSADKKIIYADHYSPKAMMQRNIGMIDNCDLLIAVYNGDKSGGTAQSVKYARSKNKTIKIIDPKSIFEK